MKRSGNSRMISRRWKSERTTTRTISLKLKIDVEPMMEYCAEAEAFEKLRNEYRLNVKELETFERDKTKSTVSLREAEKINIAP